MRPRSRPLSIQRPLSAVTARLALLTRDDDLSPQTTAEWPFWPVAALFTLAWAVFAYPWLSGQVTIPWDAKAHYLPQVQFLARSIAAGEWPFWTPNVFSGHPQIADPQSMMFSPPMLLLALITATPGNWEIDCAVFGVLLMAGFGVLWLARDLGWHWAGALVAALGFAFGASMAWRLQHFGQVMSLAYYPFALVMLRRALLRRSSLWAMAAGVFGAFIILGRDQVGLLVVYLLAGYAVWFWAVAERPGKAVVASIGPLLAGALVGLALVALPLLMTILLAASSNRPSIDFAGAGAGSLHPALLVTAVVPHLFGAAGEMAKFWGPPSFTWVGTGLFTAQNMGQVYLGAIPLLALSAGLGYGIFWPWRSIAQRNNSGQPAASTGTDEFSYLVVAFVLVALYAVGWFTPVFRLYYEALPGVTLFRRPADATFALGGLGALLAGYAVHRAASHHQLSDDVPPLWPAALLPLAGFAFAIGCAVAYDRLDFAKQPLVIAALWFAASAGALVLAWWMLPIRPIAAGLMVTAVLAADLAVNNGPNGATALPTPVLSMLEPNSPSQLITTLRAKLAESRSDTRRDRVELAGLGFHWPNASLTHNLENTLGYNPVRLQLYSRATGAGDTVGLPDQREFSPMMPSYRSLTADMLGLRYIATGVRIEQIDKALTPGTFPLVAVTPDGFIYENPRAYPRALFATRAITADFEAILKSGKWPVPSLLDTVLLKQAAADGARPRRPGTVAITRYTNTEISLSVTSPDGGWVVLNDVWHPWWFADIDGKPTTLEQANVLVRAVAVPAGSHSVRFTFRPVAGAIAEAAHRFWPTRSSPTFQPEAATKP